MSNARNIFLSNLEALITEPTSEEVYPKWLGAQTYNQRMRREALARGIRQAEEARIAREVQVTNTRINIGDYGYYEVERLE